MKNFGVGEFGEISGDFGVGQVVEHFELSEVVDTVNRLTESRQDRAGKFVRACCRGTQYRRKILCLAAILT